MRRRGLLMLLIIILAIIPFVYINRWLQKLIRPREGAPRFFLFMMAVFVLVIVYTGLVVGLVSKLFPLH